MNTYDNIIVYLWLVPVIGLIIIPLLWSLITRLYKFVERTRVAEVEGCILENSRDLEKRNSHRIRLDEGHVYIDEESDCCKADVSNISVAGICLENVPKTMELKSKPLMVLFRTPEQDYTFKARPIWKKLTDKGYMIGAEILQTPSGWENLLKGFKQPCTI